MRAGADAFIPQVRGGHSYQRVHAEMLLTICRFYSALPDVRDLSASEIRFFYDGLRGELRKATRPER